MDLPIFDQVGELVRTMAPEGFGPLQYRAHRGGVKVWFGPVEPPREHYEAQFIPRSLIDGAEGTAVEIGYHAEHKDPAKNEAALAHIVKSRKTWQKRLGRQAEHGGFLGRPDAWKRVSETWLDVDFEHPDIAMELASRVVDYLEAIEPTRA